MASVRPATPEDFSTIVELGRAMQMESPRYRNLTYSPERCLKMMDFLTNSTLGTVLVAEQGGQVVGMVAGFVSQHFFSEDWTAGELVVYVTPEARGGSAAVKLIKAYEEWARSHGVVDIVLGISTEVDAYRTASFYQRMGYAPSGQHLVKQVFKRCALDSESDATLGIH